MKKNIINGLFAVSSLLLAFSCADYNETGNFTALPDPSFVEPYADLDPVKDYIDRDLYPNMSLGAQLKVSDFNKQELSHAAAMTNFDNVAFGTSLMSGTIVNAKGVMNFLDMKDLLDHVQEIGGEVFGSPLFANANQADEWLNTLTAPIEISVDYVEGKVVDYKDVTSFDGTVEKGKGYITQFEGQNVLRINNVSNVNVIEGFEVNPKAKYTTTFWARAQQGKEVSFLSLIHI